MALPNSGPISASMIQTEFGGVQPVALSEYYRNGQYVNQYSTAPRVPTSGTIKFSDFYGASHYTPTPQTVVLGDGQTFTVPATIASTLYVTLIGAAGGPGGNDVCPGYSGYPGRQVTGYVVVSPGDLIRASVGGAGVPGGSGSGIGTHGAGGYGGVLGFAGGSGGWAGFAGWSGGGGGGGGGTAVTKNGSLIAVAGGGAGGGGGGWHSNGRPSQGYSSTGSYIGGVGQNKGSSGWYATGREADTWCEFISTYGIWQGDPQSSGPYTYSQPINFPVSGTYTFSLSVDNYGSLNVDSSLVVNSYTFTAVSTVGFYVSAGIHTVSVTGTNTGGPAALAAQILNPDRSELWNTLSVAGGEILDGGGAGGGGGGFYGGAGGTTYPGDEGAWSGSTGADLIPAGGSATVSYSGPSVIIQGTW